MLLLRYNVNWGMAKLVVEQGHGTQLSPGLIYCALSRIQCCLSGIINDDFAIPYFDHLTCSLFTKNLTLNLTLITA